MDDLKQKNAAILTQSMHHVLKLGTVYQFAICYTNDSYYGIISAENEPFIIRSKRKRSTNEFYSYVTLYVTTRDGR